MLGLTSHDGSATTAGMMSWDKDVELMARTRMSSGNRGSGRNACTGHVLKGLEW